MERPLAMATTEVFSNITPCVNVLISGGDCYALGSRLRATAEFGVTLLVMVIVIAVSLLNNTCVIYVIIKAPHLRRQLTYIFILNLCVIDVLASVLVLPFMATSYAHGQWRFSEQLCLLQGFLVTFFVTLSTTSICVISIDRLYSIKSPMHYAANMTLGRVLGVIAGVWVYALTLAALPLFGQDSYTFQDTKMYCFFSWTVGWNHFPYVIVFCVFGFILPGVIVIFMYIGIYRVARKTATQIRPMPSPSVILPVQSSTGGNQTLPDVAIFMNTGTKLDNTKTSPETLITKPNIAINGDVQSSQVGKPDASSHSGHDTAKSNKAVKTLLLIIWTFIVLWAPFFIVNVHCAVHYGSGCTAYIDLWTSILGFMSFAVNPLIYGIMNRSIREETSERLKQARNCCRHSSEADDSPGNEDFFEFLERTSVAQPRADMTSSRHPTTQRSKLSVVCGAENVSESMPHRVTVDSFSST